MFHSEQFRLGKQVRNVTNVVILIEKIEITRSFCVVNVVTTITQTLMLPETFLIDFLPDLTVPVANPWCHKMTQFRERCFIISPIDKEGIRQFIIGRKVIFEFHHNSKTTWALRSTPLQIRQVEENTPLMEFCKEVRSHDYKTDLR